MESRNLSNLSGAIFYSLKEWSEQSVSNFNILIAISFAFLMVSCAFCVICFIKIGRADERTTVISLKGAYAMLIVIVVCDMIFPRTYLVNQFFMFKYGIACFVSGMYAWLQCRKDFK
ncbi:hypothetical protein [Lactiplantibacillus plantarum]|uniref:hypothetical protein n=1 Tax=Lactiplantibacillus plantarum TaxID=1590 RepID=UPI000788770F|nr:hypothetical protein [Lactiplantibacillus plantarum]AUV71616.1 DUF2178 domain-containing protein [Lactiplantibacillus plantarum subsp. plantarum]KYK53247.1 hypothetical protein AYO51_08040 [Lactiplantibacillus plantarum]KYM70549.1 hypothetical protein AZJ01_03780 [Lactiplantibacillus plantarum]MCG0680242.1 hypothetical protein [Lactiplantibacillus plantarum]MCJ1648958.1 DUF2178 domain-containing protein [Lactiplantibacillus plantarum subsp. plantarum]